jgi:hypothetical protein
MLVPRSAAAVRVFLANRFVHACLVEQRIVVSGETIGRGDLDAPQ